MKKVDVMSLRKKYKEGTKVRLIYMNDVYPQKPGTIGIVSNVDDLGNIHVNWETGSTLALIPYVDKFELV